MNIETITTEELAKTARTLELALCALKMAEAHVDLLDKRVKELEALLEAARAH